MTPFLTAYFARIGWSDLAVVNIETLQALHLLHNAAIPLKTWMYCFQERCSLMICLWKRSW